MKALFLGLALCLAAVSAGAVNPDEMLDDPALETRARASKAASASISSGFTAKARSPGAEVSTRTARMPARTTVQWLAFTCSGFR